MNAPLLEPDTPKFQHVLRPNLSDVKIKAGGWYLAKMTFEQKFREILGFFVRVKHNFNWKLSLALGSAKRLSNGFSIESILTVWLLKLFFIAHCSRINQIEPEYQLSVNFDSLLFYGRSDILSKSHVATFLLLTRVSTWKERESLNLRCSLALNFRLAAGVSPFLFNVSLLLWLIKIYYKRLR